MGSFCWAFFIQITINVSHYIVCSKYFSLIYLCMYMFFFSNVCIYVAVYFALNNNNTIFNNIKKKENLAKYFKYVTCHL